VASSPVRNDHERAAFQPNSRVGLEGPKSTRPRWRVASSNAERIKLIIRAEARTRITSPFDMALNEAALDPAGTIVEKT
jgi:hypothetical protein